MSVTFNIVICQWSVSIRCPLETTTSEEHAPPTHEGMQLPGEEEGKVWTKGR